MKKDNNNWKNFYNFYKEGKYRFEIIFDGIMTNMEKFFEECINIISIDLSYFDNSDVTNISKMFNGCKKLKEIKGLDKFNTEKVIKMNSLFN